MKQTRLIKAAKSLADRIKYNYSQVGRYDYQTCEIDKDAIKLYFKKRYFFVQFKREVYFRSLYMHGSNTFLWMDSNIKYVYNKDFCEYLSMVASAKLKGYNINNSNHKFEIKLHEA